MRAFLIPVLASILILGTLGLSFNVFANVEQCANVPPRGENNGKPFLEIWAAICDLQNQIDTIELTPGPVGPQGPPGPPGTGGSLSCENQITIHDVTDRFNIDEDCFTGYDLGVSLEVGFDGRIKLPVGESSTLTVFIENRGPDDAQNILVQFVFSNAGYGLLSNDPVCNEGGEDLICIIESLNNGESDSLTFEILNFVAPGGILEISVTDTIFPFGTASNSVIIRIS